MSVVFGIQRLVYIRQDRDGMDGVCLSIYGLYRMFVISALSYSPCVTLALLARFAHREWLVVVRVSRSFSYIATLSCLRFAAFRA